MKKPLLLLILAASPLAAQTEPPSTSAPGSSATGAMPDPGSVWDWKFRPQVGARYSMRMFTRTQVAMALPDPARKGHKIKINSTLWDRTRLAYDVVSRDALGAYTVRLTYLDTNTASTTLSPGRPTVTTANSPLDRAFVGASFSMKIAPDGKVWSVVGMASLRARLLKALAQTPGSDAGDRSFVSTFLDERSFKRLMEQASGGLPPYPVARGDSWPSNFGFDLPMPIPFKTRLQSTRFPVARNGGVASVQDSGTLRMTHTPGPAATSPATSPATTTDAALKRVTVRFGGAVRGSTKVDEASGVPLESTTSTTMSGRLSAPIPASGRTRATVLPIDMSINVLVRIVMEPLAPSST